MKKKLLSNLFVFMTTASVLIGCGAQETESVGDDIQTTNEQVTENKSNESELFEDITWTWNIENYNLYRMMREGAEVEPKLFLGAVTYTDGTMGSVEAEKVELSHKNDIMTITIEYRGSDFVYTVVTPELWGDGESLTEEEIEKFKQQGDGNSTETDTKDFSSLDDVYNSDEYFSNDERFNVKASDKLESAKFQEAHDYLLKAMDELGILNEYRYYSSLEDFYSHYDEILAPYGLDRAHAEETSKKAEEEWLAQMKAERETAEQKSLEEAKTYTYVIGDMVEDAEFGFYFEQVDESTWKAKSGAVSVIYVTVIDKNGNVLSTDEGYLQDYSDVLGTDFQYPEKGTELTYEELLSLEESIQNALMDRLKSAEIIPLGDN